MSNPTLKLAVLDDVVAAQIEANPRDGADLEVVWQGTDLEALIGRGPRLGADVVVANLDRLGTNARSVTDRVLAATGAQLLFVVYAFARREDLAEVVRDKVRAVRSPVNLAMLKLQMMSVLIRGILKPPASGGAVAGAPPAGAPQAAAPRAPAPAPAPAPSAEPRRARYSNAELGKLQELQSAVQCECPNHVSSLLVSLLAFERYSLDCLNRDDDDAAVHRMLYERTASARVILEDALSDLLKHEGLEV